MANETNVTVVGNLTADPELRFAQSGIAVCNFTVASTPRTWDKGSGQWKDGDTLFLPCSIWRDAAEHCAESLTKGTRVIVQGRLQQRSYDDREGNKRTIYEVAVDEVGPSLLRATAVVTRATSGAQPGRQPAARQPAGRPQAADPWAGNVRNEQPF